MWDQSWVSLTWLSIAVMCTGRPVPTAVWPGTRTVPGMGNPAPDIQPHRRGEENYDIDGRAFLLCVSDGWFGASRRSRRQDVKYGNPIRQCRGYNSNGEHPLGNRIYASFSVCRLFKIKQPGVPLHCFTANKNTLETVQYGVEGSTTFLECQARSPHVSLKWHLLKENSDRRKEVRAVLLWAKLN